jgi:hypothetical protein
MSTFKSVVLTGVMILSMVFVSTGFAAGRNVDDSSTGVSPSPNNGGGSRTPAHRNSSELGGSSIYPFTNNPSASRSTPAVTGATSTVAVSNVTTLLSYAPANALGYTLTGQYLGNSNFTIPSYNASPNASSSFQNGQRSHIQR